MQTVTPLDPAARVLQEASSEALLDTIVRLTHRIHGLRGTRYTDRANELRAQRAMVRAEVLRRITAGGVR